MKEKEIVKELKIPHTLEGEALQITCDWLQAALEKYPEQARQALRKLPKIIREKAAAELPQRSSSSSSNSSSSSSSSESEGLSD
ncbi:hypothetical protein, conserved [Eimeria tenella]|uniref:Uncharacterized protein n=1 Tax=Eimeria tenella TaxID=5802 RepID=U6KYP6_EIMTE|nr:hypothetical protein, conserved [Eimeria tenella]CDJ43302.1 hypothetical protein, conserved [Eimeria tenella]|eukprot:XP_013234052.1 hypothetical protein, conserved [Eimeria tenella]